MNGWIFGYNLAFDAYSKKPNMDVAGVSGRPNNEVRVVISQIQTLAISADLYEPVNTSRMPRFDYRRILYTVWLDIIAFPKSMMRCVKRTGVAYDYVTSSYR